MNHRQLTNHDNARKYRRTIELSLIISLFMHLGLFHALPDFEMKSWNLEAKEIKIKVEDIPSTEQFKPKPPPPPPIPVIPVPFECEMTLINETIDVPIFNLADIPEPPPPPEDVRIAEHFVFVPYEEPPEPVGGYRAVYRYFKYPKKALHAGIEGMVIVGILVDERGNTAKTQILRSSGYNVGFEQAAVKAANCIKWKPAKQRERAVKTWLALPVRFRLLSI